MRTATNPKAGILAVIASGEEGSRPTRVDVVKLDATGLAAAIRSQSQGKVRLRILKDLLPAPGQLQKGLCWPDPRPNSAAIIQDRNVAVAHYFLTAFQIDVSPKASDTEKALMAEIVQLPAPRRNAALAAASGLSGPADVVVQTLREHVPELRAERKALGGGGSLAGNIRGDRFGARPMTLTGDGIDIIVPQDKLDRVTEPVEEGGRYKVTVTFHSRPVWK